MISNLGWGTGSSFGMILDESRALDLTKFCIDSGLTIFDTGPSYASGKSEYLLGRSLKALGVCRNNFVLSTKIGSYSKSSFGLPVTGKDYCKDMTQKLLNQSLANLCTDYIDIVFFHSLPQGFKLPRETIDFLNQLKSSGVVRSIGVSAHSIGELAWIADNHNLFDVIMTHYNPLTAPTVEEYLKFYKSAGKLIFGSAPFASGLIVDRILSGASLDRRIFYKIFKAIRNYQRYKRLNTVYRKRIFEVRAQVANGLILPLEFSLASEFVDVTMFGSLSRARIASACLAAQDVDSRNAT